MHVSQFIIVVLQYCFTMCCTPISVSVWSQTTAQKCYVYMAVSAAKRQGLEPVIQVIWSRNDYLINQLIDQMKINRQLI